MARNKKDDSGIAATRDDVERAIAALTRADEQRLDRFARYKVRGLGRRALGRDNKDLLHDALLSTLSGTESETAGRRWYKNRVDFVGHLLGAMRSIASHWKEAFDEKEAHLESEVSVETEDGEILSPIERTQSTAPSQERIFFAKEVLGQVYKLFQNDDLAALVIEGIRENWTGPETMDRLEIPKDEYEAAIKRIRYQVR